MKSREVVRGIVRNVEPVSRELSFVTLGSIDEAWTETRVPFYDGEISNDYLGRVVDIIEERFGFLGGRFKQTMSASNMESCSNSVVCTSSGIGLRFGSEMYNQGVSSYGTGQTAMSFWC